MLSFTGKGSAEEVPRLDDALASMANEIAKYISAEQESQSQIKVGSFDGPPASSAGPRITKGLTEALEGKEVNGQKIKIAQLGGYSVTGDYAGGERNGKFIVRIDATIKDAQGNSAHQLTERIITSLEDGLKIMGTTVNTSQADDDDDPPPVEATPDNPAETTTTTTTAPPESAKTDAETPALDEQQVAKKVLEKIKNPTIHHVDNVFFASKSSPYGVELLIKNEQGYASIPADLALLSQGFGKVDLSEDQVFAIRIWNKTGRPVGLALTIDGINVFAFSENPFWKKLGKMVLLPGSAVVKGWHEVGDVSREFAITKYGDSAAARFGATEGVGTVTATFYETIQTRGGEFGVGLGQRTRMAYKSVPASFGKVVSAVSVKYLRPAGHPSDLPPE